jgi:hypothetical protein
MYYLWLEEKQAGPYTLQQVQALWNAGHITALTLYWQEGRADWQPLGDIISEIEPSQVPAPTMETVPIPQLAGTPITKTMVLTPSEIVGAGKPAVPYSPGAVPAALAAERPAPEQTHWTGHPTWWKWAWWIALAFTLCAATGGLFAFLHLPLFANLAPLPVAVLILVYVWFDRSLTRYTVTNKRVGIETGILDRKSRELRIQDIRSIAADMNFLGYGDIEFSSAASDDAEVVFQAVAGAATVRDLVKKLQS